MSDSHLADAPCLKSAALSQRGGRMLMSANLCTAAAPQRDPQSVFWLAAQASLAYSVSAASLPAQQAQLSAAQSACDHFCEPVEAATARPVAHFLRGHDTAARASRHIGEALRSSHRHDLPTALHGQSVRKPATLPHLAIFPSSTQGRPGPMLRALAPALSSIPANCAAAIVPHLTLSEALPLPPPVPAAAVSHYLGTTGGVLDLSPPRAPVYTPSDLRHAAKLIAPLLAGGPRLTALHAPASCITSVDSLGPLAARLNTLTRLCLVNGFDSTRADNASPRILPHVAADLLGRLAPSALRHLSIDAVLDANSPAVHRLLCSFTAVTALRLHTPPRAFPHLKSLSSLFLTHVPASWDESEEEGQRWRGRQPHAHAVGSKPDSYHMSGPAGVLCMHVSGAARGVSRMYDKWRENGGPESGGLGLDDGGGPPVVEGRHEDGHLHAAPWAYCCGSGAAPAEAPSMFRDLASDAAVATSRLRFFYIEDLLTALEAGSVPAPGGGGGRAQAAPLSCWHSDMHALTVCMTKLSDAALVLSRRIVRGEVLPALRTLCVLSKHSMPAGSALSSSHAVCQGRTGGAPMCDRGSARWVTAQASGTAHAILALEMLQYNSAPPHEEAAVCRLPSLAQPSGSSLRALRVSRDAFPRFEGAIMQGSARLSGLTDLSLHARQPFCPDGDEWSPAAQPCNLACITRLAALRTLSLEGIHRLCTAAAALTPLPSLTALRSHGGDDSGAPFPQLADLLLTYRQLHSLDIEVVLVRPDRDPAPALRSARARCEHALRTVLCELPLFLGARVSIGFSSQGEAGHA
eukprot:jgi/Ulvmu1/6114/UM027_0092.1